VTIDLTALLVEFEACHRSGRAMESQRLDALRRTVKDALVSEYALHDGQIPVRDPATRRIAWKSRRQLRGRRDLELWENVSDTSGDWLDHLVATLDRMLTPGSHRNPSTGKRTPPRLAKQVADRLAAGLTIDDPMLLIIDCLKYAIYDEMLAATKRIKNGNARRVRLAPRARKHDKQSLVRRFGAQRLLAAGGVDAADLAYCVGFEYQRGGLDRTHVEPLASLRFENGRQLGAVLDAIDAAFQRSDIEFAKAQPGSTRRRPARAKGIGAGEFAAILDSIGCPLAATSLASLYRRKARRIEEAVVG